MKKYLLTSLLLSCSLNLQALSKSQELTPCQPAIFPMRATVRHIEPRGIGYKEGYTTLETFFAPLDPWKREWVPFLDVRGHVFDSGRLAANAGIGLRYLTPSRIWGINAYYDYRNTHRHHYNQIALGFESLGEIWDFRLNGYLPVGETKSSLSHPQFHRFRGHHAFLSRKYEFAFKGANAEVGAHIDTFKHAPFYFAAGPYYLEGQGKVIWGGEARAAVTFFDYLRLEGSTSYDPTFRWLGQGQLSLIIPFTRKKSLSDRSCTLSRRSVQPVDRFEIIPVDKKRRHKTMVNPATGSPYFFWFVDNTSHSAGTYESPFPTLTAAQNASGPGDIIYVFPGDGTSQGMDQGVVLQPYQKLIGSGAKFGLSTTYGQVSIPALTKNLPQLTSPYTTVVRTNIGSEVAGLFVLSQTGIVTSDFGAIVSYFPDIYIHDNTIIVYNNANGIDISQDFGMSVISNNQILSGDALDEYGILVFGSGNLLIQGNVISGLTNLSGFDQGIAIYTRLPSFPVNITIKGNYFNSQTSLGNDFPSAIFFTSAILEAPTNILIQDNFINMPAGIQNAVAGVYTQLFPPVGGAVGITTFTLQNNISYTTPFVPGYQFVDVSGVPGALQVNFLNNVGTRVGP